MSALSLKKCLCSNSLNTITICNILYVMFPACVPILSLSLYCHLDRLVDKYSQHVLEMIK